MNTDALWKQVKEYKLSSGDSAVEKFIGKHDDVEHLKAHFDVYVEDCNVLDDGNIRNTVHEFIIYMLGYDRGVSDTEDVLGNTNG